MTDPSGHLDLDELADVLAGERDDSHLRGCDRCSDRLAELAAAQAPVSAALAALPVPAMPSGLPLRLTRALQEERRRELATVRPLRRRRAPTWLPAVAASVALVTVGTVGTVGWSLLDLSGSGDVDTAASDAGGGSGAQESEAAPEAATGLALPPAGTDWADEATRADALSRLLAATDTSASSDAAARAGDGLERLRDPAALAACLSALPGGDDDVLAVDYASYAGAPAIAVVQPADRGTVRVTVVGSDCAAGDPDLLDEVVLPRS